MIKFTTIFLLFLCIYLNYLFAKPFGIEYIESVRDVYKTYFDVHINDQKRANRIPITAKPNDDEKYLIEYKFGNLLIYDIRLYHFNKNTLIYKSTDAGVFFPQSSIKDVLKVLYSDQKSAIVLTD